MNKGFANLILIGLIAIFSIGTAIYTADRLNNYSVENKDVEGFVRSLGANNTELTDTLNTFRTNVNTLNHQVIDTTSTDPGHKHTTSTITGITYTKQVTEGGTATTTFIRGIVTASGTNAFSSVPANGNGSIPIASGTGFVANTITAGSNVTVTNSAGSITIGSVGTSFGFHDHVLFTTLGTSTWVAATGTVYISMTGGGGGGGDSNSGTGKGGSAGGGGAWAYRAQVTGLTPGNSYNVFVGSGGLASAGSGAGNGGNASSSNFHNLVVCGGGTGGTADGGAVGAGGTKGTGCDFTGANGGLGGQGGGSSAGGGGGGSGPIPTLDVIGFYNWGAFFGVTSTSTINTATSTGTNGSGTGSSVGGFGTFGWGAASAGAGVGVSPTLGYGGGGSGGSGGNLAGGAGKQGFVLIEY